MMDRPRFLVKNYMRISGSRHSALDTARSRIGLISAVFVLFYILAGARVFDLTAIQGVARKDTDNGQYAAAPASERFRADIVDRNGVILATSLETASLYADPALIAEPSDVAGQLVSIFPGLAYGDVLQKLQKKSRFVWIRRNLTPQEQYKVLELGQPGLDFRMERRRIYPQGGMAVHLVGYADIDGNGLAGIERSFNDLLAREDGPLYLTLDIRLQHILRRELARAVADFSAKGGAGAIMDIQTGEILAGVSLPDFDPNNPGKARKEALFNNLTHGVFEPGSTFKIFSTAAFLETLGAPLSFKFDAREPIERGGFRISDYHPEKRFLSVPEVFMVSSNIGAALMGEMVGTENLKAFYSDAGLFDPIGIEINEIGKPMLPPVWRDINTLTASYGHGIAVSPMQLVAAASGIVNGGIRVDPTLIAREEADEKKNDDVQIRILSEKISHRMRQLLRLVVTDGTGKGAEVAGYEVGGKTGTAEKKKTGGKGYDASRKISSFLGFFPMSAPRYAVYIMVDEPRGTKASFGYATGGWVSAPAAGRVIAGMAAVLGIAPSSAEDPEGGFAASLRRHVSFEGGLHASE